MSRKTPAPIPHFRPISQKAYDTFVRRIFAVVPMDNRCADTVDALDKYLAGDRKTYAAHLDEHTAITFEMLRFEIDLAIERSARARRPRRRKAATPAVSPAETCPQDISEKKKVVASARPRKTTRKTAAPAVKAPNSIDSSPTLTAQLSDGPDKHAETPEVLPRWMRRAAIMAMRPKNKWKKIG